jgi:hypothetical protein
MYWFDNQQHKPPHLHGRYAGQEAVFSLDGSLIEGSLGTRGNRLVADSCAENQEEIRSAWGLTIEGKELPWIKPLR